LIGVFDSGHGGLTILRALVQAMPERSFVYLGDHAHMPYGERMPADIVALTQAGVSTLFDRGCKLVVLACNTAAAVALRTLQQDWLPGVDPQRRILGVLVPTVEVATNRAWLDESPVNTAGPVRTIGILATRRTVTSNVYPEEIRKRAPSTLVFQQACAGLVNLIEQQVHEDIIRAAVAEHVAALLAQLDGRKLDVVMLGCTHYPIIAHIFAEFLPDTCEVLSQPQIVARSLSDYLQRHAALYAPSGAAPQFLTTGNPATASAFATTFFGKTVAFESLSAP
jgi:glutamate racemase